MRLVHVTRNNNVPGATKSTFHGNRNYEAERVLVYLAEEQTWLVSINLRGVLSLSLFPPPDFLHARVGSFAWLIVFKLVASAPIKSVQRPVQQRQERGDEGDTPSYPSVRGKNRTRGGTPYRVRDNDKLVYRADVHLSRTRRIVFLWFVDINIYIYIYQMFKVWVKILG